MLQFSKWQIGLIAAIIALGLYFSLPNFFAKDETPWGLPESRITLGLDLQGGSYLLLQVDTDKVVADRLENIRKDVRSALRGRSADGAARITFSPPTVSEDTITVRIRNAEDSAEAERRLRDLIQPLGGIGSITRNIAVDAVDAQTFTLTMTAEAKTYYAASAVDDSIEAVRERIDSLGTTEPIILRQGQDRIVLQVPGDQDSERLKNIINAEGQLSFHMVDNTVPLAEARAVLPPGRIILPSRDIGTDLVIVETPEVTGDQITDASASPNQEQGGFQVNVSFDKNGQRRFFEATRNNVGQLFAIVLDDEIISAPRINEPINSPQMRITGDFSAQEAYDLALLIRAGALPAPLEVLDQRTVSAELGADSVRAGTMALIYGFIAVVIFMVVAYGRFGIYADIALISNVVLIAGALSLLGATLTLPGIAGIVLTIGMAVDANVLIFERIREELKAGKKVVVAVQSGYEKAFSAIFDANLTTFIAAAIMFYFGSGPVRGFAVTLSIGVLTSVFTAFVLTRIFTGGYVLKNRPTNLKIGLKLLPEDTNILFMKKRFIAFVISMVAVIASITLFFVNGLNFGIDFRGGGTIEVGPAEGQVFAESDLTSVRSAVADLDLGNVKVQEITAQGGDKQNFVIFFERQPAEKVFTEKCEAARPEGLSGDPADANQQVATACVKETLYEVLGEGITEERTDVVSATVSSELIDAGRNAVVLAVLLMLGYIWFRFEWQFSLGAIVALVHDVILTIGMFAITQLEFNLPIIAALLTIVGYSMNDTVVVYDRVRENLRKFKKKPLQEVLDLSINQTLSRTIMTSVTTLLALLALFIFGGPVLRGFTAAMIWGVIIGTYSSVFIASPILQLMGVKREWNQPAK